MLVRNVDKDNYAKLGSDFIALNEHGFMIVRDEKHVLKDFPVTARQWCAWLAYFGAKGIKNCAEKLGRYTVPAEWPHMFDADWTIADDERAGGYYRPQIERDYNASAEVRRAAHKRWQEAKAEMPLHAGKVEVLKEPPASFIDHDLLMECWNIDMESRAKKPERKQAA